MSKTHTAASESAAINTDTVSRTASTEFRKGLRLGIPIGLGYLSVSFTFGIIGITYGFKVWQVVLISALVLTSAGQFSGIQTMLLPGAYLDMLISQITINIRYSFMSVSLSQKLDSRFRGIWRWILGFAVTDEIFAVAITQDTVTRSFFAGLMTLPYWGWFIGTWLGAMLGSVLPETILAALGLALYAMFVAIVVPEMKKSRPVIYVVILAALLSTAFTYLPGLRDIPQGISISICAVAAAAVLAATHPVD